MENDILSGWKDIAAHLGKSVRTAQRWEETLGLPVHRIAGPSGDVVFARASEVDEWRTNASRTGAGRSALAQAEDGESGAGLDAVPSPADDPAPATETPVAPVIPPAPRHHARSRFILAAAVVLAALAAIGIAVPWMARSPAAPNRDAERGGASASAAVALRESGLEGLDTGPWPMAGHDARRTNQGHLRGPSSARAVRLLYESRESLSFNPEYPDLNGVQPIATSSGEIVFGACSPVVAVDFAGRARTVRSLATKPFHEGVAGIAADSHTQLVVATRECPQSHGALVGLYVLGHSGAVVKSWLQENMTFGPALAPDGTVYSLSETNIVRAYGGLLPENRWATDLAGYSHGLIALDAAGNLYVGTSANLYGQPSFWSLSPDGRVRWRTGSVRIFTPAIADDGTIGIAGEDQLFCYEPSGRLLWATTIGGVRDSIMPLAVGHSGTFYARTMAGLLAVDARGRVKWTRTPGPGPALQNGPILDRDENVYVALGNQVCSFTPRGDERWCVPLQNPGGLLIAADGVLCAMSESRRLYAIETAPATPISAESPRP